MTYQSSQQMGRPREFDRKQIAKQFVEWALSDPEAWTVPMFTTKMGFSSDMMHRWAADDEEFALAFRTGKEIIGVNRLRASVIQGEDKPKLDRSIYLKCLGNYDIDINLYERGERKFDIETKANVDRDTLKTVNSDIVDRLDRMHNQMSSLQESASNKAASKIKSET